MVDFANLSMRISSAEVKVAVDRLNQLLLAADRAEKAERDLATTSGAADRAVGGLGKETGRTNQALSGMKPPSDRAKAAIDALRKSTGDSENAFDRMARQQREAREEMQRLSSAAKRLQASMPRGDLMPIRSPAAPVPLPIPGGAAGGAAGAAAAGAAAGGLARLAGPLAAVAGAAAGGTAAVGGLTAAVVGLVRSGEDLKLLESRFKALTGDTAAARESLATVIATGREAGIAINEVADMQARFTMAAQGIGATTEEVSTLTSNVLKLGRISGTSTAEMSAAAMQLGQALASGRLQGDELRSIMESLPALAMTLADQLGVAVGDLRQMGADGTLLVEDVFKALIDATGDIDKKFNDLYVNSGRNIQRIQNGMTEIMALVDAQVGASSLWAEATGRVADYMESVVDSMKDEAATNNMREIQTIRERIAATNEQIVRVEEAIREGHRDEAEGQEWLNKLVGERIGLYKQLHAMQGEVDRANPHPPMTPTYTPPKLGQLDGAVIDPLAPSGVTVDGVRYDNSMSQSEFDQPQFGFSGLAKGPKASSASKRDPAQEGVDRLKEMIQELGNAKQAIGMTESQLARFNAEIEANRIVSEASKDASVQKRAELQKERDQYVELAVRVHELQVREEERLTALEEAEDAAARNREEIAGMIDDFGRAVTSADSFNDALKDLGLTLLSTFAKGALTGEGPMGGLFDSVGGPLTTLLGSAVGGFFGGGTPALPSSPTNALVRYANGGVFDSPTALVNSAGQTKGVMAEAGAEAIMPLERGPGGKLGVRSSGGGNVYNIDARHSTNPAETEAAVRRAMNDVLRQSSENVMEMERRGIIS